MPITAVIFDMDGVLIDSGAQHHESWRMLAREVGGDVGPEAFARSFGRQNRDVIPMLFGDGLSAEQIEAMSERKEALFREHARGRIREVAGAVALVRQCADAGMPLAIGSSGHPLNIEMAIAELNLAECFPAIITGHDVVHGKPNPEVFLKAAAAMRVPADRCAVVEDAPSGVAAARSAGMFAIGLATEHPQEKLSEAHLVVDSLAALSADRIARFELKSEVTNK